MSNELLRARSQLSTVSTLLKQGKLMAAVTGLFEGFGTYLHNLPGLYKTEKEEFHTLINRSLGYLNADSNLRQMYPLVLKFELGKEKNLLDQLKTILNELQGTVAEEAKQQLEELLRLRENTFAEATQLIDSGDIARAKKIIHRLIKDDNEDVQLKLEAADLFMKRSLYEPALEFLELAYQNDPESVHIYNRMAMALRKLARFEDAEKYYLLAIEKTGQDEVLFFNLGRVYVDSKNWPKVAESAQKALSINPDFKEARMMLDYAQKQLE